MKREQKWPRKSPAYARVMKVPNSFVRVMFLSYAKGCGYTGGQKAPTVAVNSVLRTGHTVQEKNVLLVNLWSMFQQLIGVATEQLAISLQKIPASNAMEMGQVMQAVEHE